MTKDNVHFQDSLKAGLDTVVAAPACPCPRCGSETKDHHPIQNEQGEVVANRRICSARACRYVMAA
jgi:hypothetical protein